LQNLKYSVGVALVLQAVLLPFFHQNGTESLDSCRFYSSETTQALALRPAWIQAPAESHRIGGAMIPIIRYCHPISVEDESSDSRDANSPTAIRPNPETGPHPEWETVRLALQDAIDDMTNPDHFGSLNAETQSAQREDVLTTWQNLLMFIERLPYDSVRDNMIVGNYFGLALDILWPTPQEGMILDRRHTRASMLPRQDMVASLLITLTTCSHRRFEELSPIWNRLVQVISPVQIEALAILATFVVERPPYPHWEFMARVFPESEFTKKGHSLLDPFTAPDILWAWWSLLEHQDNVLANNLAALWRPFGEKRIQELAHNLSALSFAKTDPEDFKALTIAFSLQWAIPPESILELIVGWGLPPHELRRHFIEAAMTELEGRESAMIILRRIRKEWYGDDIFLRPAPPEERNLLRPVPPVHTDENGEALLRTSS